MFAPNRLLGVDAARGLAIVGMLVVHLTIPEGLLTIPAGRSSALFGVLVGTTLTLLTGGAEPPGRSTRARLRLSITLRGAALIMIGLALWEIPGLPFAVIIDVYGALILVLIPLLFAPRPVLIGAAALFAIGGSLIVNRIGFIYVPQDQRLAVLPSVWFVTGQYPGLVFIVYLLMGMIAGRSGLDQRKTQITMIATGALLALTGYGVGAVVPGQFATPHSNTLWEVLGDGGVALTAIGLAQLVAPLPIARTALTPLAALGSMSLTVYVLQVIAVLVWPFSYLSTTLLWSMVVGSVLFALVWRRLLGSGPLERIVRRLSMQNRT